MSNRMHQNLTIRSLWCRDPMISLFPTRKPRTGIITRQCLPLSSRKSCLVDSVTSYIKSQARCRCSDRCSSTLHRGVRPLKSSYGRNLQVARLNRVCSASEEVQWPSLEVFSRCSLSSTFWLVYSLWSSNVRKDCYSNGRELCCQSEGKSLPLTSSFTH